MQKHREKKRKKKVKKREVKKTDDSLLSFDEYQKLYPDKDVHKSLSKYLDYTDSPTHDGALRWLKHEKNKKKSQFEKTLNKKYYKVKCSKCGNKELPRDEFQLRKGSECCGAEYSPVLIQINNSGY